MSNLWLSPTPLVLASKSQARRALLAAAGIPFEPIAADLDERLVEAPALAAGHDADAIAALLAREKAVQVSARHADRLVLGADQTLSIEGRMITKPLDREAAKAQLLALAGKTHTLHAALCLVRDRVVVSSACAQARMTCRPFSEAFIESYLDLAGDRVLQSVGGYAVEGLGIHLFDSIVGEQSTIVGLPMLELLELLRAEGAVAI